jgi:hypothetical protein
VVKRPSQALCWPLGLIGCSPSRFQDLQALETFSSGFCIFYKLRPDSHTQCVHCLLFRRHSCLSVCPSLYKCALRLVWPVNSPTAALSLNLFMASSSLVLLGRRYLISTLDCRYQVQAAHLARCLCSNCFLMRSLPTLKGIAAD